jgi:hypothetical protein
MLDTSSVATKTASLPPPFIFTGTVVARKALRPEVHRFAASELDPGRHPGVSAPMSSTPQPAPQIPVFPRRRRSRTSIETNRQTTAQPRAPRVRPLPKSVMHVASNPHAPRLQFPCAHPRPHFSIFVSRDVLTRLPEPRLWLRSAAWYTFEIWTKTRRTFLRP